MRIVLTGDSHLAYLDGREPELGDDVVNVAVGGSVAVHLSGQLATAVVGPDDVVVVSVGTNDAAPLTPTDPEVFASALDTLVTETTPPRRWVYLAPPGLVEGTEEAFGRRNVDVASYGELAAARFDVVVDTPTLIAPLGPDAFQADGVHLTDAAYDLVLPAVAAACDESKGM